MSALRLAAFAALLVATTSVVTAMTCPPLGLSIMRAGGVKSGTWFGSGSFEVLDYDPATQLSVVVEARREAGVPTGILVVNSSDPSNPTIRQRIAFGYGSNEIGIGSPNSVSIWREFVAVAVDGWPSTSVGFLRIYNFHTGQLISQIETCAMPDMLYWTPDGSRIFMVCEGEPSTQEVAGSDPTVDPNPNGGIVVVKVSRRTGVFSFSSRRLGFQAYIDSLSTAQYNALLARGFRINPRLTKATAARDIEPEYLTCNSKYTKCWVTLQENNAVAALDMAPGKEKIAGIWPLGWKDWSRYPLDASDRDGGINMTTYANVYSWYQPDTIKWASIGGQSYLFMANEGDSKEDTQRVADIGAARLDPMAFPEAASLVSSSRLGRFRMDPLFGLKNGYNASAAWNQQGPYDKIIGFGARSFTILNAQTGELVFESGSQIETLIAGHPEASRCFNCDREGNLPDTRSDDAGVEPEAIDVFPIGDKWYVAVGLERQSGFVVYDVTNPAAPVNPTYYHARNFDPALARNLTLIGDLAPEQVKYVPASESGSGKALLLVTNEVSATLAHWEVEPCTPGSLMPMPHTPAPAPEASPAPMPARRSLRSN